MEGLGGSSLGFDVLIILLPFPIIQRLQLNLQKKIALGCLFALGFFVSVIQIIRIRTIAKLANYTDSEPIIVWSIVEIHTGVCIACMPSFAPLLKSFGQSFGKKFTHNSHAGSPLKGPNANPRSIGSPHKKMLSNGYSLSGLSSGHDRKADKDELRLWDVPQRAWAAEAYAWSGDSHPVSDRQGDRPSPDEEHGSHRVPRRESDRKSNTSAREITVVSEITVQAHDSGA